MNNLFIVNNFFHLLTAFILSKSYFITDNNYLVLIHPVGYSDWKNIPILSYISSTNCGYKKIFLYDNFLSHVNKNTSYSKQLQLVKEDIDNLKINNIFLGNDKDPKNQLFVATLGFNNFYRFEDGLYSYYNKNIRRKTYKALFHKLKLILYKYRYNIRGNIKFNTTAIGDSESAIADFLYKPTILKRYSPNTIEISKTSVTKALNFLKEKHLLIPKIKKKTIIYLSQPLVEQKKISLEDELSCLKIIYQSLNKNISLLFKPHPEDSFEKISYYKKYLINMNIYDTNIPVELLYYTENNIISVISYRSTGLMYSDIFSSHNIKAISLSNFSKYPIHPMYKKIMHEAGVFFPTTQEELKNLF